jgi:hypothetical protein
VLGGVGSAVAVALTLDPSTGLASSGVRFAFWFSMTSTLLAVLLTGVLSIAEYRSTRPQLPKAIARRTK